jgi:hypothetical protein
MSVQVTELLLLNECMYNYYYCYYSLTNTHLQASVFTRVYSGDFSHLAHTTSLLLCVPQTNLLQDAHLAVTFCSLRRSQMQQRPRLRSAAGSALDSEELPSTADTRCIASSTAG